MIDLTSIQQQVLRFILARWDAGESLPSSREIMNQCGWSSPKAATDVLDALKRKGLVASDCSSSRKYRITELATGLPVLGDIPAGIPVNSQEVQDSYFSLNTTSFGIIDRSSAFFLRVKGDSMIGRKIFDGDLVLVERSRQPRHQDIVVAFIDNESTLKTLIQENGMFWLRSENPDYPDLHPFQELQIQGVALGVIRHLKS